MSINWHHITSHRCSPCYNISASPRLTTAATAAAAAAAAASEKQLLNIYSIKHENMSNRSRAEHDMIIDNDMKS